MKLVKINLWYILLFLFSINLFNMESRIIFGIFLILIFIKCKGKMPITKSSMFLGIFSILFYLLASIYNPTMMTYYILPFLLGPFMGYTIGYIVANIYGVKTENSVKGVIYTVVFGRFIHGLLNFMVSNGYIGFNRNGMDFWTKSIIAATGQGALMTMVITLLFYSLFIVSKKKIFEKSILFTAVILAILNSILSASRTALIIMITVFMICILYTIISSNIGRQKKGKMIFGIILLVFILLVAFQKNIFGIKTMWETSPLFERVNMSTSYETGDENRKNMYIDAMMSAVRHPMGDGDMSKTAHNLWLDTLRQTGWITFGLLLAFTFSVIRNVKKILKSEVATIELKYLILSVVTGILLNFFVEPIMKGMPYYFVSFCIIGGALERYKECLLCFSSKKKHLKQ